MRFASDSARRFLTSRFRRIPFLIASDLSALDNFRVVFLALFIAIPLPLGSRVLVSLESPRSPKRHRTGDVKFPDRLQDG